MKTFITGMTCLVSLAASPALAQQNSLHGIWVGGHPAAEGYVMLRMQVGLDSAADDAQASIGIPGRRPQTSPITLNGSRVSFEFDERGGRAAVSATLRGDTLVGPVRIGKETRPLHLMRIQTTPPGFLGAIGLGSVLKSRALSFVS
jgi:hypothetical protein